MPVEDWHTRPLKVHVRNLVADACSKGKKRAIMFPAGQALDVATFLAKGVLTKKTKLTAIEGDADTARKMWVAIFRLGMGPKTKVHNAPAHELSVTEETDLAFLDFCGPGKHEEINWISDIAPKITGKDADVFLTLKLNNRGAGYFSEFARSIVGTDEYRIERARVTGTLTTKVTLAGEVFNEASTEPTLKALACQRIALRRVFAGLKFDMKNTVYRDLNTATGKTQGSREMSLIHLSNFRKPEEKLLDWS